MGILTHYLESYRNLGAEWLEEVRIDSAHPFKWMHEKRGDLQLRSQMRAGC